MTPDLKRNLAAAALEMRNHSYAPYSGFTVGAALLTEEGEIYTGCNIENAAFSPSICAERVAIFKAVSEGKRAFSAIAIAGGRSGSQPEEYCPPCGVCRQVMSEFCDGNLSILLVKSEDDIMETNLDAILPFRFSLNES